jgi:hypothetical protein
MRFRYSAGEGGSHLMGGNDHYLIADQSGVDPHRLELAKLR